MRAAGQSALALPEPWPGEARRLLCALLGAGSGLLEVWEALDQAGYISRILPEWDTVRFRPPQSAIHRFTVDRHLLETCVEASKMVRDVRRPDLLLVAALLHDLGKAVEGDHSVTGAVIAGTWLVGSASARRTRTRSPCWSGST